MRIKDQGLVLGIDLGTSYFKLGLFSADGALRGLGRVPVILTEGGGLRAELPVPRFWEFLRQGLTDACCQAATDPREIHAVAYSSQANSFVLLDAHDQALTPLVIWTDRRVQEPDPVVRALAGRKDFMARTGLGVDISGQCGIAKLRWFQRHEPTIWARTRRVMTISDYLTFGLTGEPAGDMGTAALLGVLDLPAQAWWREAVEALDLAGVQWSRPLLPGTVLGGLSAEGAQRLGLRPGVPFAVGSLDHHMASLGAGAGRLAEMSESTGTVVACLYHAHEYRPTAESCTGPGLTAAQFYQLAFSDSDHGAGVLEWYQKQHAPTCSLRELDDMARDVDIGSAGLVARPGAERCEGLSGFVHATAAHHHGHYHRALLESIAFTLAGLVGRLCGERRPKRIVATGGGARSDVWLQIKADMLDAEFVTTPCPEPACAGAAMLAARAAGWFPQVDDVSAAWVRIGKRFTPDPQRRQAYARWAGGSA